MVIASTGADFFAEADGSQSDWIDQLGFESISVGVGPVLVDRFAVCARGGRPVRRNARRQALHRAMLDDVSILLGLATDAVIRRIFGPEGIEDGPGQQQSMLDEGDASRATRSRHLTSRHRVSQARLSKGSKGSKGSMGANGVCLSVCLASGR